MVKNVASSDFLPYKQNLAYPVLPLLTDMPLKDYYELLQVPPGSPELVIRKAFRKLAMRYHPDRNMGNPYATQHFREIQEAYEVLSNPVTRSEYHQKRWLHPEMGKPFDDRVELSPSLIEKEAVKIASYVKNLDQFRMNYEALYRLLDQLLSERHLAVLIGENQEKTNAAIIYRVLQSIRPLPYNYLHNLGERLVKIAGTDNQLILHIHQTLRNKRKQYLWDRYKGLLMIAVAILICLIIYLIA